MASQEVKYIDLSELVLWSENPRDSIDENSNNQEITNLALQDKSSKWSLPQLAKKMGDEFDSSEIPTVVYHAGKPVVYDGNRRVILGMLKHGYVKNLTTNTFTIPDFPKDIPCNVCTHKVAIRNVFRKHSDTGSWSALDRDLFVSKFMDEVKSTFLLFDETTNLITNNPVLNQGYVKDEILTDDNLEKMGFKRQGNVLLSRHNETEVQKIFDDLVEKINNKEISTRRNRGNPIGVLGLDSKKIIDSNKTKTLEPIDSTKFTVEHPKPSKKTAITRSKETQIFGEKLVLQSGDVNNLYSDITAIYEDFLNNPKKYSKTFIGLIRMSLRLIVDLAAGEKGQKLNEYLESNFVSAKQRLSQDFKTTLNANDVTESNIVSLLHQGAHTYSSALSKDKAIAMSIIIGSMLMLTHGKKP
jgi:uncharacterized protein YlaI